MQDKKIVAVWIGKFPDENTFYRKYMSTEYDEDGNSFSAFGTDVQLEYFDEDFIESWWFEQLDMKTLLEYKPGLLDQEYFFDQVEAALQKVNLSDFNTITFLFGETKSYGVNKDLFDYKGMDGTGKPIEFLLKVEYSEKNKS